jgi:hypothetical protein
LAQVVRGDTAALLEAIPYFQRSLQPAAVQVAQTAMCRRAAADQAAVVGAMAAPPVLAPLGKETTVAAAVLAAAGMVQAVAVEQAASVPMDSVTACKPMNLAAQAVQARRAASLGRASPVPVAAGAHHRAEQAPERVAAGAVVQGLKLERQEVDLRTPGLVVVVHWRLVPLPPAAPAW